METGEAGVDTGETGVNTGEAGVYTGEAGVDHKCLLLVSCSVSVVVIQ